MITSIKEFAMESFCQSERKLELLPMFHKSNDFCKDVVDPEFF